MLLVPGSITIRLHHRSKGAERMLSVEFSGFIERMKSLCNCCLYFDFDIDFMPFKMDCKGLELVSWSIQLSSHGKIILVHPDCVFLALQEMVRSVIMHHSAASDPLQSLSGSVFCFFCLCPVTHQWEHGLLIRAHKTLCISFPCSINTQSGAQVMKSNTAGVL